MLQHALLTPHSPLEKTPHKTRVIRDGLMLAAGTAIHMASERGRAAARDGSQHTKMLPAKPGPVLFNKAFARRANDVCHLNGWLLHFLCSFLDLFTWSRLDNSSLSSGVPAAFRWRSERCR